MRTRLLPRTGTSWAAREWTQQKWNLAREVPSSSLKSDIREVKTMALNYAPMSQCVSLFVANQFRVCVRQTAKPLHRCYYTYVLPWVPARTLSFRSGRNNLILYQQTSLCLWRDNQKFSTTPTLHSPHTSFVREKYLGNKTGPGSQLLPFMSKTGKNKKLARVKSCTDSGKKVPSRDKLKYCRPRAVSSAGNLNADLKLRKLLMPLKGETSDGTKNEIVSVSQVAREMVHYFNKFIDHLNKMDTAMRLQRIRDNTSINKPTDSIMPLILPAREATNSQTPSNLPIDVKISGLKTAGKKKHSGKKKKNARETVKVNTDIDKDLEKIRLQVNQVRREACTLKDPIGVTELLEIRPKYVENVQHDQGLVKSNNTLATTPAKNASNKTEVQTDIQKYGFVLVESTSPGIIENKVEPKNQGNIPCNEKGFILLYPEDSKKEQTSNYCSHPEEKGFTLVNNKANPENSQKRSKQDNRNFVLVNDNPFCNSRSTKTDADESKRSQVSNVKDVLPRPDINVQLNMAESEALGSASLNTKYGKHANNRISSLLENQTVGSSDSKEELQRQRSTVSDVETRLFVGTENSKPDGASDVQSLNPRSHNWMAKSQSENVGLKTSLHAKSEGSPETKMAAAKKTDDLANRNNIIQAEKITTKRDSAVKSSEVKTQGNATRKDDKATIKNDGIKKTKQQFQGNIVSSKSAHELHVGAFGNAMNGYFKFNLKSSQGKKQSDKKGLKRVNSFVSLITKEETKPSTTGTSPVSVEACMKTNMGSSCKIKTRTSATFQNIIGFNNDIFRHQRSPAVAVHELKPDLQQKKVDRRSPNANMSVAKGGNEPQLFVKPEEMSNKIKLGIRPAADMVYLFEQSIFPQVAASTYQSVAKRPAEEVHASSSKPSLDVKQTPEQFGKIQSQDKNKCQINILSGQENNKNVPMKAANGTTGLSPAISAARSLQVTKGMTLSDVFQHLQHTKLPRSPKTTTNYFNAAPVKTRTARTNNELIRIIQQQWSQDFQEKFRNLQPNSLYSPYSQSGGNCSTEATQNSNTSAGSRPEKEQKTSPYVEKTYEHKSPPAPNMVQVNRKSDHLPTMGMAERLLAASQRPSRAPGTNDPSPKVKDSASSINTYSYTDATVTQGTAEVDDFPEVDQFEEWIQHKMPEVGSDSKDKTTQPQDKEAGLTSTQSTTDSLKQSNDVCVNEGSNVDGELTSQTATQQPTTRTYAEPAIENKPFHNLTIANTIMNDRHPFKNTSDISSGTNSRSLYKEKSASMTNTSLRKTWPADIAFESQDSYGSHRNLTNTTNLAREAGSSIDISHTDTSLSTSNITRTELGPQGTTLSKSKMLGSLDGFACMTLVQEPQKSSSKNLKPTLKRSPSQERGVEKRVSFVKISKDDTSKAKYSVMGRPGKQIDRYVGSSVDLLQAEDNFSGGNNSKECNLRNELAEQRKRAEMEARIKLLNEHSKQIREYEAVLSKYRDIVGKFRDDALKAIRGRDSEKQKSSDV